MYTTKRLAHGLLVIWLVGSAVFFLTHLIPGGPAAAMLGGEYTAEAADAINRKLGLDKPIWLQYAAYWGGIARFDLGSSLFDGTSVTELLTEAFPKTLSLAVVGTVGGLILGIGLGIWATVSNSRLIRVAANSVFMGGLALPTFWIGMLLILLFAVHLGWFPSLGYVPLSEGFWPWLERLILPSVGLSLVYAAPVLLIMRQTMEQALAAPYIRTARSKGLSRRVIVMKHALPNALIPVVTMAGLSTGVLLSGTVVTESLFAINGIGRLLVSAIHNRDYPIVQGVVLLVSAIFVVINLAVDFLYAALDPRVRVFG